MPSINFPKRTLELILSYWLCTCIHNCCCYDFDQNYFGVSFLPYVKYINNTIPSIEDPYTYNNVVTMLNLVSQKVSRIFVKDKFRFHGEYIENHTYLNNSYASLYTGEIAAKMNRKNASKTLTVMYQVREKVSLEESRAEINLAFEAAKKANAIFPGTVEGVCFGRMKNMDRTLDHFRVFQARANSLGIKLGLDVDCTQFISEDNIVTVHSTLQHIVRQADFVSCWGKYKKLSTGPANCWEHVQKDLLAYQRAFKHINPKIEITANSFWSSAGLEQWDTLENLRNYWKIASEWASKNKYKIFMFEVFDNPWRKPRVEQHQGWWRLADNSKIDSEDGYVEKISEIKNSTNTVITLTSPVTRAIQKANMSSANGKATGSTSASSQKTSTILAVVFGICTFVLLTALGIILIVRRRNGTKQEKLGKADVRNFLLGTTQGSSGVLQGRASAVENAMNVPYDNSLEISKDKLKIDPTRLLGSGQFGFVFKGIIELEGEEDVKVAIKTVRDNCRVMAIKGLLSEIKIMMYLGKHKNIVELKGAYTAELYHGVLYVATERCSLGSLQSYLRNKMPTGENSEHDRKSDLVYANLKNGQDTESQELVAYVNIPFQDMVRWSQEIACGMEHLEAKQVVHADLATRNVLLSADKTAKISDFGLSRRMYNYMNYVKRNQEPLPWRWMAVESLKRMEFSSKSDVWAFGVTLWEIFSKGDCPYPGITFTQSFVGRLESGLRPNCPKFASPEIYNVMRDCWSFHSKERPSFQELTEILSSFLL